MGNNEGLCRRCGEIEPHGMDCECPCEPCFGLHPDHIADAGKNVQPATPLLDALEVGNPVVQPTPAPLPEGVESDMEEATAVLRKVQDVLRNEDLLFAAEGLRSVFHALSHISDLTRRLAEAEAENGRFAGMLEDSVSGWRKLYTEERAERVRIEGVLLNDVQAERQESDEHINGLNVVIKTQDKTIRDLKSRVVELAADWQVQFAKAEAAEARVRELEAFRARVMELAKGRCEFCKNHNPEHGACPENCYPGHITAWTMPRAWEDTK